MNEELRRRIEARRDEELATIASVAAGAFGSSAAKRQYRAKHKATADALEWVLDLLDAQPTAVSLPEEARCELCHDAIEQNEACVLDPTGDRWHLCNRFGVDCWEYANTPLPSAPAVSLELPEPPPKEQT